MSDDLDLEALGLRKLDPAEGHEAPPTDFELVDDLFDRHRKGKREGLDSPYGWVSYLLNWGLVIMWAVVYVFHSGWSWWLLLFLLITLLTLPKDVLILNGVIDDYHRDAMKQAYEELLELIEKYGSFPYAGGTPESEELVEAVRQMRFAHAKLVDRLNMLEALTLRQAKFYNLRAIEERLKMIQNLRKTMPENLWCMGFLIEVDRVGTPLPQA